MLIVYVVQCWPAASKSKFLVFVNYIATYILCTLGFVQASFIHTVNVALNLYNLE